jgi:hypothetical protein
MTLISTRRPNFVGKTLLLKLFFEISLEMARCGHCGSHFNTRRENLARGSVDEQSHTLPIMNVFS